MIISLAPTYQLRNVVWEATLDKAVISDELCEKLAGRRVIAGLFTTYAFDLEFFELDVIPLLLDEQFLFSTDERVKLFQVREALRESNIALDVFFDINVFNQEGNRSPTMEYGCHGVNQAPHAFHAKNIYLLIEDENSLQLLVAAGSNNLTRAGWWDNIECQHWVEVADRSLPREFLNRLRDDLEYLASKRAFQWHGFSSAIDKIEQFLAKCSSRQDIEPVYYYGFNSTSQKQRDFIGFLKSLEPLKTYNNWQLEIISPFFSEQSESDLHRKFFDFGVKNIVMLLPKDSDNKGLCDSNYYHHISREDNIQWGCWRKDLTKDLGIAERLFRRLHAKIYHFYNGKQSWVFVGSVNFSPHAFFHNVESGFFVKQRELTPFLEPLTDDIDLQFALLAEEDPGSQCSDEDGGSLELHLCYDWKEKALFGKSGKAKEYIIQIESAEGQPVIEPWTVAGTQSHYRGTTDLLERLLKHGSLVRVVGKNPQSEVMLKPRLILLQQLGWSHKPMDFPSLSPEQIIAIYSGMSRERRQAMLMNAQICQFVFTGVGGEITIDETALFNVQFFCEYAELFHAFRQFKQKLLGLFADNRLNEVDYYLTGSGMDSLPTLLALTDVETQEIAEKETQAPLPGVTAYLIKLCALEIYCQDDFVTKLFVAEKITEVNAQIIRLEKSNRIVLEDNSSERRSLFFKWFKEQFKKQYTSV